MQQVFKELKLINFADETETNENTNAIKKSNNNTLSDFLQINSDIMQMNEVQTQMNEMQADEMPMQMDEIQVNKMQVDEMQIDETKLNENLLTNTNNEIIINELLLIYEDSNQKGISNEDYIQSVKQCIILKNK